MEDTQSVCRRARRTNNSRAVRDTRATRKKAQESSPSSLRKFADRMRNASPLTNSSSQTPCHHLEDLNSDLNFFIPSNNALPKRIKSRGAERANVAVRILPNSGKAKIVRAPTSTNALNSDRKSTR